MFGNIKRLAKIIMIVLIIVIFINGSIFVSDSSTFSLEFFIYNSKNILGIRNSKFMEMKFYLPQTYESATTKQEISKTYVNYSPKNYKSKEIIEDQYGNSILHVKWGTIHAGTMEFRFSGKLSTNFEYNSLNDQYPIENITDGDILQYLQPSKYVFIDDYEIENLAKQMSEGLNLNIQAVDLVFKWVKENIDYNPDHKIMYADAVLLNREGNKEGILHLILSLLRSLGVPSRACIGYAFEVNPQIDNKIDIRYEGGYSSYIEVYFPSLGWVPFDPFNFFSLPINNMIKYGSAKDFMDLDYFVFETDSKKPEIHDFFKEEIRNLKIDIDGNFEGTHKEFNLIYPSFVKQYELDFISTDGIGENIPYSKYNPKEKEAFFRYYYKQNNIKVPLSENIYQPIYLNQKVEIDKILIPMIRQRGSAILQLEIYKNNLGDIGELVASSKFRNSSLIPYSSKNYRDYYQTFFFENTQLDEGKYFIKIKLYKSNLQAYILSMNYNGGKYIKPAFILEKDNIKATNYNFVIEFYKND